MKPSEKLEKGDDFESELLFELRKFASERSLQDEKHLISILRGGSQ
ncbi:MAG: hypothetical protein B655_2281 [Methanobacterium sp. Maddingley MBC34]|nr:MAG: hypothetical protein B655_2281 [Methanobacterium sp. Maddingley MBC34]